MKKVVGTLVFLAAFLLATSGHSPEYEFRNVWKIKNFSVVDYEDLDGDGLSEILCIKYQNTKEFISNQTVIALLDIHSTILWQIKVDGFLSSSQFEDIDGDGIKEIFLDIQVISSNNICPQFQKYKLICVNAQGTVLWKKMLEKWFLTFNDIDKDGCKEIMVGSVILDKDGNIYAEYDDYSITGCIEDPFRIILDKKINNGTKKEYISYKIVTIQGETLWEKKFLAPAVLEVVEVENKKRVFILTKSEITELNLNTYEETFCSTYNQELYRAHMNSVDIDGDNNIEYVIETLDHGIFGSSSVYVYDDTFKLLWKYTDPAFYAKIEDLDNDKKHEILIYYRNMYMDGIVDNGFSLF